MTVQVGRPDASRAMRRSGLSPLDLAAEALVANPSASLATVAEVAGIGRTTLHKHYGTRENLLVAVAHRALDLWEQAVSGLADTDADDGGLHDLVVAMVPIGPQLSFLWRNRALDNDPGIGQRWAAVEPQLLAVLTRARRRVVLRQRVPDWWLLQTLYSLVGTATESIWSGHLAPRDAPDLVVSTWVRGLGPAAVGSRDPTGG